MTKFAKFDKATLNALRSEMQEVMNKYAVKTNLDINVGNMRFSEAEVTIKVEAKIKGATTRSDSILEMMAKQAGLAMTNSNGDQLTGYNTRAKAYPYQYTCGTTGKRYKCSAQQAKFKFSS
jgi:uncharacterized protein YejL (UPF0352 family)|tara:strand:+ start:10544 stop:10906 length:363 start_codon:yes stop_codon:yes gene_type:complete